MAVIARVALINHVCSTSSSFLQKLQLEKAFAIIIRVMYELRSELVAVVVGVAALWHRGGWLLIFGCLCNIRLVVVAAAAAKWIELKSSSITL